MLLGHACSPPRRQRADSRRGRVGPRRGGCDRPPSGGRAPLRAGRRRGPGNSAAGGGRGNWPGPDRPRRRGARSPSALHGGPHGAGGLRLFPGAARDGACDRGRLLLRLRVAEPITAEDLGGSAEMPRVLASDSSSSRRTVSTDPRSSSASGGGPALQAGARRGARRRNDQPLSQRRLRDCAAGRTSRRRSRQGVKLLRPRGAYWRGDSARPKLTRIYGTRLNQADLDATSRDRGGAPPRPPPDRHASRPLPLQPHSPGSPLWHPRGMVIWNALEGPAPLPKTPVRQLRRGEEDAPLRTSRLWKTSGRWEKFRDNMFLVPGEGEAHTYGLKPMNCPGAHAPLRQPASGVARELPIRYAEASSLHPERACGNASRPHARRARDPG